MPKSKGQQGVNVSRLFCSEAFSHQTPDPILLYVKDNRSGSREVRPPPHSILHGGPGRLRAVNPCVPIQQCTVNVQCIQVQQGLVRALQERGLVYSALWGFSDSAEDFILLYTVCASNVWFLSFQCKDFLYTAFAF